MQLKVYLLHINTVVCKVRQQLGLLVDMAVVCNPPWSCPADYYCLTFTINDIYLFDKGTYYMHEYINLS